MTVGGDSPWGKKWVDCLLLFLYIWENILLCFGKSVGMLRKKLATDT